MKNKLTAILSKSSKGFTLIELLVVLGILGILAVAILAAINPIEQLNKAQDASSENTATVFVDAVTQYYSVHNTGPFGPQAGGVAGCTTGATITTPQSLQSLNKCITALQKEGELKNSFAQVNPTTLKAISIYVNKVNGTLTTYACFIPQSKAVKDDPNTKYKDNKATPGGTACPSLTNKCYWCAQ